MTGWSKVVTTIFVLLIAVVAVLAARARIDIHSNLASVSGAQATSSPSPQQQSCLIATPQPAMQTLYPLPGAQDLTSANTMTAGGVAMIQASQLMACAAQAMIASGDPKLVDRGQQWQQDARALADDGAWMVVSASADSMIHDPAKAKELDLLNLRGNGISMSAEGEAMAQHGEEMLTEVAQLRESGALPAATADDLAASAKALIASGQALQRDGQRMQDTAESLLRSLGK